jgi:hypothetical protein
MTPIYEAVPTPPDGYVPEEPLEASGPDPAKVIALQAAVALYGPLPDDAADLDGPPVQVVEMARRFEAYLTGEEAP